MTDQTDRDVLADILYEELAYKEYIDMNDCREAVDAILAAPRMAERLAADRTDALEEAAVIADECHRVAEAALEVEETYDAGVAVIQEVADAIRHRKVSSGPAQSGRGETLPKPPST